MRTKKIISGGSLSLSAVTKVLRLVSRLCLSSLWTLLSGHPLCVFLRHNSAKTKKLTFYIY